MKLLYTYILQFLFVVLEYRDLCNFVIPRYMNNWKEIGIKLGLRKVKLTAIENERLNKAQDCCYEMLDYWLQFDVNASWEKIKEVVQSLSDIDSMVPPSDLMVNFKQYLYKQYEQYNNTRIENAFICHQSKMPTRESVEAVAKTMYYGNIVINGDKCSDQQVMLEPNKDNKYYEKCKKSTDILKLLTDLDSDPDREDPFVLFIEGAQGIGKTGICRNIAFQWAKHRGLHGESTLLLCLHDKNLEEINSLVAFLKHEYRDKPPATYETISKNLNNNEGKKVMFIIDGYERCINQQKYPVDSFVQSIVDRRVLQKCDLVISSCHTASSLYQRISCRIELLGFTETAKEQYINNALDHNEKNINELMDYLKEHRILNSLCYNPLCLSSLIRLFQQFRQLLDIKLPSNQTEIINRIANRIVLSFSGSEEKHFQPLTTAVGSMPKECRSTLNTIGKLAFYSLQTNIVFRLSDIDCDIGLADAKKCCLNGLGFLKVVNAFENTDINQMLFSFLHISLQEFLAAFYVSTLSQSKHLEDLWEKTFWKSEFLNVWAYYYGITSDDILKKMLLGSWSSWLGIQNLPNDILQNKIKCLYLVHCLMESQDSDIYQKVKPRVIANDGTLDLSSCTFTQEEFKIVVLFLSRCGMPQWTCLDLSSCCIDDHKLAFFFQQLQYFVTSISSMKVLNLCNNQLSKVSLHNIFKMATIFQTIEINLSCNQIDDQELCECVLSFAKSLVDHSKINIIQNCKSLYVLKSHNSLLDINLKITAILSHLYIFRCSLKNETMDSVISAVKSCNTLSSVFFYDNNLLNSDVIKLFDGLKVLQSLKSVLILEKTSLNVQLYKIVLFSNDTPLARQACEHPLIVFLQLNMYNITDDVMSQIAVILNSSSQRWSLLDLSDTNLDDNTLIKFCNALNGNCTVDTIKLANNKLNSLSVIIRLIQCLNPSAFDVCGNNFAMDDNNSASVSMIVAKELFAHDKQLSLTLICDDAAALVCNQTTVTGDTLVSHNITQLIASYCTVSGEVLLKSLNNNYKLTSFYLANTKWSGEPFYNLTESFEKNIFFSICENVNSGEMLGYLVSKFDTNVNVSSIISTNDIFIANKCHFNVLKLHLTQEFSQLSSNVNLFYVRNCFLEHEPNIISDYLSELNMVTEIMLCNNGLSRNNVWRIGKSLKQLKMLKAIFICELQKQLLATKVARNLLHLFNCSFIIIEDKVVIGNQASLEQLNRCLSLVPSSPTILRFISCSFGNEHCGTLVDVLNRHTTLEEFSLYECDTNDIWTKQLVEALQVKSKLRSLLLSFKQVTSLAAYSIANALSTVISNNPTLEKVSFKFDNLPSSACGEIFQALSNIRHLKHFRFCDGLVTTKEAIKQLYKVIANNSSLEVVNLRNNRLRNLGITALAKGFKNIHHLKLLALNGNQIDEEAADDVASIIANNVEIEKLLLYNNALKSEGICTICQNLKYHKNLKAFCIGSNDIQERAAYDIAEVVKHNPLLKVVDIGNNRLLAEGVIMITECLHDLQKLSLNDNNITCTANAAISIASIILSSLKLKALHLDNNNFSVSDVSIIAKAIKKLAGLKELTINNTGFTADHISTMIANNLSLEILNIGDNKLKSEGIRNISKALIKLSHLRVLGLCGNDITDDAASDIAGVISKLPVLEKLQLSNNAFGIEGMQTICKSLQHNGTLKLLQLDNVGIIEEVADDLAAVIDCNSLLECIYLGNNALHSNGAKVILNSLKNKKQFKALGLNNNGISEDIVDNVVQFVTSNPELEELLLNNNSIGTTGVINICRCMKDNNILQVFDLADNNVNDEATDPFVSVIESNTVLEEISLDANIFNNNISTMITRLSNLKVMQIICKPVAEHVVYESVDFILANCCMEEIIFKYLVEEIHYLSPVNTIDTIVVIKVNVTELASHIPVLHSVVMEDRVEIVCTQDDVLVKSEVMKLINVKSCKRIMLVFTRMNCFTDQEINNLASTFANDRSINSLTISKLNASKYNSDVSSIVIIEEGEMIVMLTDGNLKATGIPKVIRNNIISLKIVYAESVDNFFNQNINEIVNLIFDMTKLKYFLLRNDCIHVSAMENVFSCLTRTITIKTIRVLNNLNVRNFDFTQKSDELSSQNVDTIDNSQLDQILCALRYKVDLKGLDLCGITINKEVAQSLSFLIDETSKIELLNLRNCSLGTSLKYINLQKVTTLKWLSLSNNNLTEEEPIRTILGSNIMLEELSIERNCFHLSAGDKLSTAITTLRNLKDFGIDENIVSREMVLKLTTAFSTAACRTLHIFNHHYQSTEGITVTGSLHNITTLTLLKSFAKVQDVSFLAGVLKTGVMFSLWDQDNALSRAGVIRWLSSSRSITAIKLFNDSKKRLTKEEEDTIVTVIKENTQLEKVLLGSQSSESVNDDFITYNIEHNRRIVPDHQKPVLTSKTNDLENGKIRCLSLEFLFKIVFALKDHANLKALNLSVCANNAVTEGLAEQLAIVLANSTKLETLLLENCYFGNNGLNLIANSLKNIPALKDLDLSNNDITEDSLIVSILEANAGLEKLRLHKNCFHPTAGDRLIVAIVKLKNLKELSIDNYIIRRRMGMKLATAFSSTTGRILYIYDHDSQAMVKMTIEGPLFGINTLTMSKDLITESDLSTGCRVMTFSFISETGIVSLIWGQSNISTIGVLRFLSSLKRITTLEFLNINDTEVTELEVDIIATVISENEQLQNVLLSTDELVSASEINTFINQLFPNEKLQVILCALQNITELRTLDLSGNVITEELAEQLSIVLANSTKLETLLLEDCSLGNVGVNVIATSLKNITTLKHLHLSNNNITKEVAIVNILNDKVKLEKLYIHKNCLQLSAIGSLSDYVVNLKCLKELSIDHNIISSGMVMKFTNFYFPSNEMVLYIYNSDHQTTEVIKFRDSFKDINVLTLRKSYNERGGDLLVTLILGNESALYWDQSNVMTPTGVIKFLIVFRNITTIKVLNFSGSEFTELEVDTIVTVISENLQLENLWLCVKASNASDIVYKGNKQLVSPNQLKEYLWNRECFHVNYYVDFFLH